MGTYRIYTGEDGNSHWEAISLDKTTDWSSNLPTSHIVFREDPAGKFQDWHPAPRRQFVILLSGGLEIGFGCLLWLIAAALQVPLLRKQNTYLQNRNRQLEQGDNIQMVKYLIVENEKLVKSRERWRQRAWEMGYGLDEQ